MARVGKPGGCRCSAVDLLRAMLSVFAMLNAAGWAALALAWAFRPDWAERLPLQLGTHQRYLKAAPVWARLAAAPTTVFFRRRSCSSVAGESGTSGLRGGMQPAHRDGQRAGKRGVLLEEGNIGSDDAFAQASLQQRQLGRRPLRTMGRRVVNSQL